MTYLEYREGLLGDQEVRVLEPGDVLTGIVKRKPIVAAVIDDDTIEINEKIQRGPDGAAVFDRHGLTKRAIVHVTPFQAADIRWSQQHSQIPGAVADEVSSLWRRARLQTGDERAARWTLGRALLMILSDGATEKYSY